MKFLTDQDVYLATIRFLVTGGHDVATAAQHGLARASDVEVLNRAHAQDRILITRDRDFGRLVFVHGRVPGIVYLRMPPSTLDAVHAELGRVLSSYGEHDLRHAFVVVEPGRHRMRRI